MADAPDRLDTARLVGVRLSEADLDDFRSYYADPVVMRSLAPDGEPYEAAASTELFRDHLTHWCDHGFGTWVFRHSDGTFVGRAGLRSMDLEGRREVELYYGVVSERWGRGYATEIARGIIEVAFGRLDLPSLVAFALPTNAASLRVLEKCGFEKIGALVHAGLEHGLFRLLRP